MRATANLSWSRWSAALDRLSAMRSGAYCSIRCPVWRCGAQQVGALLRASGIALYGAALRDDTADARTVDYSRAAVAIGSEGHGLSEDLLALCDKTIRLPMSERCESLNAAVAAVIVFFVISGIIKKRRKARRCRKWKEA